MAADKSKKMKVTEKNDEENSDHIDRDLVFSIEKLQEIQDELDKINEEASDKVLEVEQKSNVIRKPLYEKRHEIINSIPDFWLTAFLSHPALGELLTEEDQKILKYQSSLEVEDFKDVKSGYFIKFNFNPNPYFENTNLTKSITYVDEGTMKITGTSIKWKEGKGIPNGVNHEKKGNKRSAADESFFTWFNEVEQVSLDENVFHDEVAEMIKDDLWSNPLKYFNIDVDEEDFGVGDEEEKENDEQENDENNNEDDELEDDVGDEEEEDGHEKD